VDRVFELRVDAVVVAATRATINYHRRQWGHRKARTMNPSKNIS
jgi:hypothetical protein